jgi:hypothetical protein
VSSGKVNGEVKRKKFKSRTLTAVVAVMMLLTTIIPSAVMADSSSGGTLSTPTAIQENSEDSGSARAGSPEEEDSDSVASAPESTGSSVIEDEESVTKEQESITDDTANDTIEGAGESVTAEPESTSTPVTEDEESVAAESMQRLKAIVPLALPRISDEYAVTFEVEGATYATKKVAMGQTSPAVQNPTLSGKVFTGWTYTDNTDPLNPEVKPFHFSGSINSTIITDNLTVTATFEIKSHKVFFMSADPAKDTDLSKAFVLYTDEVADDAQTSANVVDFPEGSVPQNQVFDYWSVKGAVPTVAFDFATPITNDITLIPQFSDGYYVWFNSGGTAVEPQVVLSGGNAIKPAGEDVPERTGYTFDGWYELKVYRSPRAGISGNSL